MVVGTARTGRDAPPLRDLARRRRDRARPRRAVRRDRREPVREAAERAFDYERSWFDPVAGTWPDLRGISRSAGRAVPAPSADSWCNGSPGIALSRMRAAELLGTPVLDHDAALAFAACERRGTDLLRAGSGRRVLALPWRCGHRRRAAAGAGGPDDRRARVAAAIGRHGIDHAQAPSRLPCGVPHGVTPGLFLGLAGIGMFYLRLADPAIASPLLVRRRRLDSRTASSIESAHPARSMP